MSPGTALSLSFAPVPPSRQPEHRPITLAMRMALGLAHTGALYREPNNTWRSRAFPDERITDATVRGLEQRGLLLLQEYEGLHRIRRACMVITPAGRKAYGGGRLASHTPPPVQAEAILREVETALALLSVESEMLAAEQKGANEQAIKARHQQAIAQQTLDRVDKRLAALAATRAALDARRIDLRCLVVEAAERMMGGEIPAASCSGLSRASGSPSSGVGILPERLSPQITLKG